MKKTHIFYMPDMRDMGGKHMPVKLMGQQKAKRRSNQKMIAVRTDSGVALYTRKTNGERVYKVSLRPSRVERREDSALQTAVFKKTQQQLASGVPVARYDATRRSVCLEYPDGHIEYT